jgi:tetratricopeptide (TPR) repeat protein
LFFANQCAEAAEHFTKALAIDPDLDRIPALLGICQKREGRIEDAQRILQASLKSTKDAKIRLLVESNLADIYYQEGDLQQAGSMVEDLLKNDPKNPNIIYMVYRIHSDIAEKARNALATIAPDSARMHQMIAQQVINDGDASDAIVQYRRALAIDPQLPGGSYELAEAILLDSPSGESLNLATTLLMQTLTADPRNAGAEAKLGTIAAIQNDSTLAESHFSRALAIQPNDLDALKGMAQIAMNQGRVQKAVEYLLNAIQVSPLDDALHYRLSLLYHKLDKRAESEREMEIFKTIKELKKKSELGEQRKVP